MLHPYRYFGLITVELCTGSSCGRLLWRVRDVPCEGKMSTFRHDLKMLLRSLPLLTMNYYWSSLFALITSLDRRFVSIQF